MAEEGGSIRGPDPDPGIEETPPREPALAHLAEVLVENPFDQEACYAAAQQLRRLKNPAAAEAAAAGSRSNQRA